MAGLTARLAVRDLPLRRGLATARGVIAARRVWLVGLEDAAGRRGWGEAAPLPGFGGEAPEACAAALARACADPGDAAAQPGSDTPCARHAMDWARRDLAARQAGVPLAAALGGDLAPVPLSALAADAAEADAAARDGFRAIKLKASADPQASARLARAVHAAAPQVLLRVDANGAWDEAGARAFIAATADLGLDYLEQPLAAEDWAGHARLHGLVPIALDESLRSAAEVERAGCERACLVAVLKPMFLGGWAELRAAVAAARRQRIEVVLGSALDGAVGRAAALHAAAALGLRRRPQGLATGPLLAQDLVREPPLPLRGHLAPASRPGLGLDPA